MTSDDLFVEPLIVICHQSHHHHLRCSAVVCWIVGGGTRIKLKPLCPFRRLKLIYVRPCLAIHFCGFWSRCLWTICLFCCHADNV